MDVGVGSFSDPEGLEGLAHFLGKFYYTSSDLDSLLILNILFYFCLLHEEKRDVN